MTSGIESDALKSAQMVTAQRAFDASVVTASPTRHLAWAEWPVLAVRRAMVACLAWEAPLEKQAPVAKLEAAVRLVLQVPVVKRALQVLAVKQGQPVLAVRVVLVA